MIRFRYGARAALMLALGLVPAFARASAPASRQPFKPRHLSSEELAAVPRDGTRLLLHGAVFDPTLSAPDFTLVGLPKGGDSAYGIVQFQSGRLDEKERLEKRGVAFVGYIPDNAFLFRLTADARALVAASPAVRWSGAYEPGFRVHSRLWPGSPDQTAEVTVILFAGAASNDVAAVERQAGLRALGAVKTFGRIDERETRLRFAVPKSQRDAFVAQLASLDAVAFVEPYAAPHLHSNNNASLGVIQSDVASTIVAGACSNCTLFTHNIIGTGQIVTVADSGNDSDMCFFRYGALAADVTDAAATTPPALGPLTPANKLIGYWVQPGASAYDNNSSCAGGPSTSFHGTHTSGSAVGDSFTTLSTSTAPGIDSADGMAPNAKLLFQDVGDDPSGCLSGLSDPYNMYLQALGGGARVHSNSYGSDTLGAYTSDDAIADRFLFDHEEMTIFFSAGNSGSGNNTTGSPGNSKSVVTVGALISGTNPTTAAAFSSRGPTDDGRAKPDIMAPGSSIVSAGGDASHSSNNCTTQTLSGTSMACPTAAGGSALLRQYFADGFYPTGAASAADAFEAGSPLVKAVLLNGTHQLGTGFGIGNNALGWGRMFLDGALFFTGDARKLRVWNKRNEAGITTGQSDVYTVTVGAGQEFRATLVWNDPEPAPGAAATLVNNLNLTVNDGTNTYLGNVFTANFSSTGGTADVVNPIEQVRIAAPTAGTYTITVNGASIPGTGRTYTNRQGYALVVSFATCTTAVAAAPTGLSVVNHSPMGADLSWTAAPASTVTQVYRAIGGCAAPAGAYQYIGSTAGTTFTDSTAQGGYTYGYKLRAADGCGEGPASSCQQVAVTGTCNLVPTFSGLSNGSASGTLCRVSLAWGAGSSNCPAGPGVRYNVYRSTTPNFTPAGGNLLTTLTGVTSYNDDTVVSGTTYYYVVRAEDTSAAGTGPNGGNEENNSVQYFATAFGPAGVATGTWNDNGGDTNAYLAPQAPWQVTATQFQAGTRSYHCGADVGTYPPNLCAAVTTPPLSLSTGSNLSYFVRYNVEDQWDGVVTEISTDGGSSWATLLPTTPVGYPNTLAQTQGNACNYPATQGAFSGPTGNAALTAWTQYQTLLSPLYDNKTVRIRWRFTSDGGAEFQGFFLDTISVTNVFLPTGCTATPAVLTGFAAD